MAFQAADPGPAYPGPVVALIEDVFGASSRSNHDDQLLPPAPPALPLLDDDDDDDVEDVEEEE